VQTKKNPEKLGVFSGTQSIQQASRPPHQQPKGVTSDRANIRSLRAFLALLYFELNALVLGQGFESRAALDFAEMREQVFATAFGGNKPEAFAIIKPLNSTNLGRHIDFSIKLKKCVANASAVQRHARQSLRGKFDRDR
jgi:hypothetical protein